MNEQHQEIGVWLEDVFGGEPVPSYELNKQTIRMLHDLRRKNMAMDEDTQLVIEDLRQKTNEYNAEASRLESILRGVGLASSVLSQSGVMSLRTLANVALLLQIKDVSNTNFLLALQTLQDELYHTEEAYRQAQITVQQLRDKTRNALLKYNNLKRSLGVLKQQAESRHPEIENNAKQTSFCRDKAREYKDKIQQLQRVLKSTGVDPSVYHGELVSKAEELQKLKDQMTPLKDKLQTYHSLPPDISLTKVKIEELKREVNILESEVCQNIDLMHI